MLVLGAIIVLWWRRQQLQFYRSATSGNRAPGGGRAGGAGAARKRIPFSRDLRAGSHRHGGSSLDARFIRLNQRFCEIMGYSREELLGLTFRQITHPEDLARDEQLVEQLLRAIWAVSQWKSATSEKTAAWFGQT